MTDVIDRPILFRPELVKAILDGRKTQTRRIMKPQPQHYAGGVHPNHTAIHLAPYIDAYCGERKTPENPKGMSTNWWWWTEDDRQGPSIGRCPYGAPGDRLWVKEAWQYYDWDDDGRPKIRYRLDGETLWRDPPDEWSDRVGDIWIELSDPTNYDIDNAARDRRWRSPMFMPRWASRVTLEITNIRIERVQDISEDDAEAEGVTPILVPPDGGSAPHVEGFARVWDSINGAGSWDTNPWVWAITFRRQT